MKLRPTTLILAIETTDPHPDKGRLLCIGYKELLGEKERIRVIKNLAGEKVALASLEQVLRRSHIYISWEGEVKSMSFLTAKMLVYGIDPSPLFAARHIDLYSLVSSRLGVSASSLYEVCRFFRVPVNPILKPGTTRRTPNAQQRLTEAKAKCRAEVAALDKLTRRLVRLIMAVYSDLPTLL
ncbi:hypothetical protein HRbin02_00445 [Candidatus Calditenuaceae archaeon HR02]|nr:hypothetical protein HRbin02_00445 [Candidatus Calditenuaceae archaeon HR02]